MAKQPHHSLPKLRRENYIMQWQDHCQVWNVSRSLSSIEHDGLKRYVNMLKYVSKDTYERQICKLKKVKPVSQRVRPRCSRGRVREGGRECPSPPRLKPRTVSPESRLRHPAFPRPWRGGEGGRELSIFQGRIVRENAVSLCRGIHSGSDDLVIHSLHHYAEKPKNWLIRNCQKGIVRN